ncbi:MULTISPECIES: carboxymuconolactone decarboxylase family protein [unclassified Pseudofrankia]|uniref:carboxymuconolactone decarboxylase family protein n=1 Tax=unclassified Pseudofrankia TaxID=2994372 RepID=UPI0008D989F5|nr:MULTISPECIES: carboxymuconolactone decarboxylase family protein [unclassified Pseudofrankia]MDT3445783.1 carboxymuconolactone decarboxylase family protein [Pseudofrankia sp. BMG5.37]OHV62789.1 carboxymuconolactone decarboxylase [Pseudofrankia sp. BMG5.36]
MMTQAEREMAYERVREQLGLDMMGTGQDAAPLPPRLGREPRRGSALPIESEVYAAVKLYEYGEIWGRPGLDLRTRCFISIAAVAAMGHEDQLYRQINSALNVGMTPEEVHEALIQVSVYGGISAWEQGVGVANEVFVARGILSPGDGVTVELKAPMDHDDRKAAAGRMMAAVGAGRLGLTPDAPPLEALPGAVGMRTDTTAISQELAWIGGHYGYGEVWGRPGLELRTRSFLTMAILQVMHENDQLQFHVNNALNLGITQDEVQEALVQAGLYGGTSGWNLAANVARYVFQQRRLAGQ